jgi:hypothetical protein
MSLPRLGFSVALPRPPTQDQLDRALLALAGLALVLVAAGGTLVLLAARRHLRELTP